MSVAETKADPQWRSAPPGGLEAGTRVRVRYWDSSRSQERRIDGRFRHIDGGTLVVAVKDDGRERIARIEGDVIVSIDKRGDDILRGLVIGGVAGAALGYSNCPSEPTGFEWGRRDCAAALGIIGGLVGMLIDGLFVKSERVYDAPAALDGRALGTAEPDGGFKPELQGTDLYRRLQRAFAELDREESS